MKKLIRIVGSFISLLCSPIFLKAQNLDRVRIPLDPEFDNEVLIVPVNWEYTGLGVLLFLLGYAILSKSKDSERISNLGCLIQAVGGILLLPLAYWVIVVANYLLLAIFAIAGVVILIVGIASLFK